MADTEIGALRVFLDLHHRMPPQRKFGQMIEMYQAINATWAAQERRAHPQADERELFLRVAARRLGRELVRRAYGWAPDE